MLAVVDRQRGFDREVLSELYGLGASLIPLGGVDGKAPLVKFQGRYRLPLNTIIKKMQKEPSQCYGIRLDGLTVVDIDSKDLEHRNYAKQRFGTSNVIVETPNGYHVFFSGETRNSEIRKDGIQIDLKSGPNSYIVGPGSIRPDGGMYRVVTGAITDILNLPKFHDDQHESDACKVETIVSQKIKVQIGVRVTEFLFPAAIKYAQTASSETQLFADLRAEVDNNCQSPETVKDSEIANCAKWAWQKRLDNSLWHGESVVQVKYQEFEALMQMQNGELGLALLLVLRKNHSNRNQPFAISSKAMHRAQVIPGWSRQKYDRAKAALIEVNLIDCLWQGGMNKGASLYRFTFLDHLPDIGGKSF